MRPDLSEPGKHAGPSILESCWRILDDLMDDLVEARKNNVDLSALPQVFQAQGVAECLAIFTNPYNPNVDAIRAEAMERWEARHAE